MNYLVELAIRVGSIYGGIAAGFFLQKLPWRKKISRWLTIIGLNIFTPILLILVLLGIEKIDSTDWIFYVLACLIATLLSLGIDWFWIKKQNKELDSDFIGAELSAVSFMNSLFYPFPIILGLVGLEGLFAASIYVVVNFTLRNTLGIYIGVKYGSSEDVNLLQIIKKTLLFPPTAGIIIGGILRPILGQIETGDILALNIFRDIVTFLMLILVGLSFRFPKKEEWQEVPLFRSSVARFGGGLITVGLIFFFPISAIAAVPLAIQSLSPPAVNNSAYSNWFKLDDVLTSRLIALLTLIALIFLPLEIFGLSFWLN